MAAADCFLACEALLLTCFCEDFFWLALGDLSPMVVVWLVWQARAEQGAPHALL